MRAHVLISSTAIDIASLWVALRRRLPIVLAMTASAGLATFGAMSLMPPRYTSEARLAIVPKSADASPATTASASPHAVTPQHIDVGEAIHAHVGALTGDDLVRKVAEELQLGEGREFSARHRHPSLASPHGGESGEDRVLSAVLRGLEVAAIDGRIISVRFTWADRQVAADFANSLAERYRSNLAAVAVQDVAQAAPIETHIVSRALPSTLPSFPNRGSSSLLAMAAAWLLGMAWVVKRELLAGDRASSDRPNDRMRSARPAAPAGLADVKSRATDLEALHDDWFLRLSTIAQIAQRLLARSDLHSGIRTLVTGEAPGVAISTEAAALVRELACAGRQVVLIDWTPDGGMFEHLRLPARPGITDLLEGRASFEGVITRVPGSRAHVIPAGAGLADAAAALDADRINLVLDALDEVYDHIVIAGEHEAARALFGTMEGRFDAGVALADGRHRGSAGQTGPGRFLGFDVIDIDVIRYQHSGLAALLPRRLQLACGRRAA